MKDVPIELVEKIIVTASILPAELWTKYLSGLNNCELQEISREG